MYVKQFTNAWNLIKCIHDHNVLASLIKTIIKWLTVADASIILEWSPVSNFQNTYAAPVFQSALIQKYPTCFSCQDHQFLFLF